MSLFLFWQFLPIHITLEGRALMSLPALSVGMLIGQVSWGFQGADHTCSDSRLQIRSDLGETAEEDTGVP